MGLLDFLFGDDGDDAVQAEMMRQAAEDRRQEAARKEAARIAEETRQKNIAQRNRIADTSRTSATNYFGSVGLNPADFSGDIDAEINRVLGMTAEDDPNIGSYLDDLGRMIYERREDAGRERAGRDIDMLFSPDFERQRIGDDVDDPILNEILMAERGEADTFVDNLLRRGVITETGRQGAMRNLDTQTARVRSILDEVGGSTLAGGRQNLTNIANRGRSNAQTLRLGQSFDPNSYGSEVDTTATGFLSGLGDRIRSQLDDDLFDTSGLAAIAGAAQGARNTKFDPNALAGIQEEDDEDEESTPNRRVTF